MTAEQFYLALRRFISRRSTPHTIFLDKAPQFKLTKKTIDKAWQQSITHGNVQRFTSDAGIKWKFITEFSPMDGRLLREMGWNGKINIRNGNSKKVSNTYLIQDCLYISMAISDRQKQ